MSAKAGKTSNDMQGGTFITAGSTRTYDDDRFASAPRGILFDSNALKALKPYKPFDCTRNGAPLALWLEYVDKAIYANPSVSQMWQGFSADHTPLAEQSLPRKLADLANVTIMPALASSGGGIAR